MEYNTFQIEVKLRESPEKREKALTQKVRLTTAQYSS